MGKPGVGYKDLYQDRTADENTALHQPSFTGAKKGIPGLSDRGHLHTAESMAFHSAWSQTGVG